MEQGDLGTIKIGGHEFLNPLGLSIVVGDLELVAACIADGNGEWELSDGSYENHDHDPTTGECLISAKDRAIFERVEAIGAKLAVAKARVRLRAAGLDIADRPISVRSAIDHPELAGTSFHVLTPIIALADQDAQFDQLHPSDPEAEK